MSYVLKNESSMDEMLAVLVQQLSERFADTGAVCDM